MPRELRWAWEPSGAAESSLKIIASERVDDARDEVTAGTSGSPGEGLTEARMVGEEH